MGFMARMNRLFPTLSVEAEDTLLHTTGNRPDSPETGRNMLVCPEDAAVSELVAAGFLESRGVWRVAGECAWAATPAGLARALAIRAERTPKKTRGKRRYDSWLVLRDAMPNLSFREFLVSPEFKEYR